MILLWLRVVNVMMKLDGKSKRPNMTLDEKRKRVGATLLMKFYLGSIDDSI